MHVPAWKVGQKRSHFVNAVVLPVSNYLLSIQVYATVLTRAKRAERSWVTLDVINISIRRI